MKGNVRMHFQIYIILSTLIVLPQKSQSYTDFVRNRISYNNSSLHEFKYSVANDSQRPTHFDIHKFCSQYAIQDRIYINCSGAGIGHVPELPKATFVVDLSKNKIENVPNYTFSGLYNLHVLDLSDNPLEHVDMDAFNGLSNLSMLYIRRSQLYKLDIHHVDKMIANLPMLNEFALTLQDNLWHGVKYCLCPENVSLQDEESLHFITSVPYLEIDSSYYKEILKSALNVWKTKYLHIIVTGPCFYKLFEKTCFQNAKYLQKISVSISFPKTKIIIPLSSTIVSFANDTFDKNEQLISLEIQSLSKISDFKWFISDYKLSEHLRNISIAVSQLKKFKFLSVQGVNYGSDSKFSFKEALSPLLISTSIQSLDISTNGFIGIDGDLFSLPISLKNIIAHDNCLSYLFLITVLHIVQSLQVFDASEQNYCLGKSHMNMYLQEKMPRRKHDTKSGVDRLIYTHSIYSVDLYELNFLRNAKYIDLSWNSNKLNTKVLRREFFEGLPNLEYLDLTGYTIEKLQENATFHKTLRYLNFTSNALWKMGCTLSKRFAHLPSLIDLHLSDNKISCLSKDTFAGLKAVQILDLSKNELETFEISLKHLQNIRLLNLSNNNIRVLTKTTMDDLDAIPAFSVDLSLNKLTCNCESLDFLKWLQRSRQRFVGLNRYVCRFNNNSFVYLTNLQQITNDLDRSCSSNTVLVVVCCFLLAFITSFILGGIIYRYRWKLRYLYYMSKLQIHDSGNEDDYERLFDYDAFISYASDDFEVARSGAIEYLEQRKSFRLCIHEREFKPGESIAFNISKGIHSSKRTFLFFSKSFLQSEWCKYELNIARVESMYSKRNVILVIMLEDIPTGEMTLEMMDFIKTYTYLEYPNNGEQADRDVFWSKCADFIDRR